MRRVWFVDVREEWDSEERQNAERKVNVITGSIHHFFWRAEAIVICTLHPPCQNTISFHPQMHVRIVELLLKVHKTA